MIDELTQEDILLREQAGTVADQIRDLARQADGTAPYGPAWLKAIRTFHDEGWLSMLIPPEYGGRGSRLLSLVIVQEQLARVDGGLANCISHEACSALAINRAGEDLRKEYFERMLRGSLTCIAITEPDAGSDIGAMSTQAEAVDDGYAISGEKAVASLAGIADIFLIWAKTDPSAGTRGVSTFLTTREQPGIEVSESFDSLGYRQLPHHRVVLEGLRVPTSALIGAEGQGLRIFSEALNVGRVGVSAQALGLALGAYEKALVFARERRTFGRRLVEHQAIQFKLADMFMAIESARAFAYAVARFMDASEDLGAKPVGVYAAAVKAYASDMSVRVTEEAVQILGARGLWKSNDVERLFRDAKVTQIVDGGNELMRMRVGDALAKGFPGEAFRPREEWRDGSDV
jgi:alkylation response protein AidB-like acyl-CoA dehydrogenase